MNEIVRHVEYCAKRVLIKEKQSENFQKRLQIAFELEKSLEDVQTDSKTVEIIENIVKFYK